jgi:hypothetical protein
MTTTQRAALDQQLCTFATNLQNSIRIHDDPMNVPWKPLGMRTPSMRTLQISSMVLASRIKSELLPLLSMRLLSMTPSSSLVPSGRGTKHASPGSAPGSCQNVLDFALISNLTNAFVTLVGRTAADSHTYRCFFPLTHGDTVGKSEKFPKSLVSSSANGTKFRVVDMKQPFSPRLSVRRLKLLRGSSLWPDSPLPLSDIVQK